MALSIIGGINIQPQELNFSASQQTTDVEFLSADSGSYIYSGSNPILGSHSSLITFENSGSVYTLAFSGSGYVEPFSGSYTGSLITANIDGLTSSASIAEMFKFITIASSSITASILGANNIITLVNNAATSSYESVSTFPSTTLITRTTQIGHLAGYYIGSDTTGSLQVTGSVEITGSLQVDGNLIAGIISKTTIIPSASALQGFTTPVLLGLNIPAGKTPVVLSAFQFVSSPTVAYSSSLSSSLQSSGSNDNLFTLAQLDDMGGNEYRFIAEPSYNAVSGRDLQWSISGKNPDAGDGSVIVVTSYFLL